jgi:hypothetical protein
MRSESLSPAPSRAPSEDSVAVYCPVPSSEDTENAKPLLKRREAGLEQEDPADAEGDRLSPSPREKQGKTKKPKNQKTKEGLQGWLFRH